jgi:hypothetical protein
MTTKKRERYVKVTEDELEMSSQPDGASDSDDRALEDAIKDFAEGERVIKLYRLPSILSGGRPRLLAGIPREDFNDVMIQDRWGGGRYFGRWKRKDGTYRRFNFEIEGEPKPMGGPETDRPAHVQREEPEPGPYRFLGNRGDDSGEARHVGASESISTVDILRIIAETRKEAREEMRMFAEMLRPAVTPPDATEKVFSLVEKIVPLIVQGGGGGDGSGGNPWLFALSQLKDPIMKAVDTIHLAVTKQGAALAPVPAPPDGKRLTPPPPAAPQPVQPEKEPEPQSEEAMLIESFRPYMAMMTRAASVGGEPADYCNMILDQVPELFYDRLRTWLLKPGCLDDLAKLDSNVYAQQAWWNALRGLLLESLNEVVGHGVRTVQPEPDSDPTTSGATPGNPAA